MITFTLIISFQSCKNMLLFEVECKLEEVSMNKPELITKVSEQVNCTKKVAEEVTNSILDVIMDALIAGDKVVLSGFGTFEVHERAKKTGRNPQTGEEILIEGSKSPVFKCAKVFKESVN